MDFRIFFKERLCQIRKEYGETQAQVAKGIGTATRYYQKLEAGEGLPGLELFVALADHYNISTDYLLGRKMEEKKKIMVSEDYFKERLRQLRNERKETQAQVGAATGIGEQHYRKFEAGDNFPNPENLCALADHFEVSVDYLLGREEKNK